MGGEEQIREKLDLAGLVNDQNRELSNCTDGAPELESCGTAPDIRNITAWLNTPNGSAVDLKSLRGKVVLIDRMVDTAPYVAYGGHVDGCLTRLATAALLNVTAGGGSQTPTFIAERRPIS